MHSPRFLITAETLRLIAEAVESRAWIRDAVVDVSWLPALQREVAARLAHSSTAIEGNPLTLPEVEALACEDEILAPSRAKQEARNYLNAMRWIWGTKTSRGVSEKDLLRLHRLLMEKTLPSDQIGSYKKRPNRVVDAKGRLVYAPPPPEESRPLTRELLDWIERTRGRGGDRLHPILVSAIAHHRLVSIHPFADGNGRVSRALAVWLLHARGFDTHHLFALDEFYEQDRERYYLKLQQARDLDEDLTYWLEYVAEGVVRTLNKIKARILLLQVRECAPKLLLTKRQEEVLRFLRDRGRVKSPDLEAAFKITRARVSQILGPLVKAGLVRREGRTRATSYRIAE